MGNKGKGTFIFACILFGIFAIGLLRLFVLGYDEGNVYPPYSSYRSGPLGTRVLFGALESLPGISVSRNIGKFSKLGDGRDKTMFLCGATTSEDPENTIEKIEAFISGGGRLVTTFYPLVDKPFQLAESEYDEDEGEGEGEEGETPVDPEGEGEGEEEGEGEGDEDFPFMKFVSIEERWGFSYEFDALPGASFEDFGEASVELQIDRNVLPYSLTWHSSMHFGDLDEEWEVIYSWNDNDVIMQRPWDNGTIVVCSDSYFISNEAMLKEQHPGLLAWLIGPSSTIIFNETHLGIMEQPGVMTLARKYRLHWVIATLVLLALLFIWQNMASLVPKNAGRRATVVSEALGRDSATGLVNLLRRSISSRDIVAVCVKEWHRSFCHAPGGIEGSLSQIREVAEKESARPARQRNSVRAYRNICEILSKRSRKRGP